jgi:chromosome segregation ATPase
MKIDPESWLLASVASALLMAGGAFVRAAFLPTRIRQPAPEKTPDTVHQPPLVRATPDPIDAEIHTLREQLTSAITAREAQRAEMVEQRQRAERQVQGAQAEIQRLSAELDSERSRVEASQRDNAGVRQTLAASEQELAHARANMVDPKALASLSGQVADLQRQLQLASEERDGARAKAEALERLIEGVRARSRELAEQVRALKGEPS